MIPGVLMGAKPGERILDLCSAPGNKTAQMALQMNLSGTVIANDSSFHRLKSLRQTIHRLGLPNICLTQFNAAAYPDDAGEFDRVLADVPCSCEGTSRKNPSLKSEAENHFTQSVSGLQRAILRRAIELCRPGGRVIYSTCTFAPEENECAVNEILEEFGSGVLELEPARLPGLVFSEGLTEWEGKKLSSSLKESLRIWPHQNDSDGFYVAVLRKKSSTPKKERTHSKPQGPLKKYHQKKDASKENLGDALTHLQERFGIAEEILSSLRFFQNAKRSVSATSLDLDPPVFPRPDTYGIRVIQTPGKIPKLTTSAALYFGDAIARNRVNVDETQARAYLLGNSFEPRGDQLSLTTGKGYVVLFLEGFAIGVALLKISESGARVESQFPGAALVRLE